MAELEKVLYVASRDIAERSGMIASRYRTKDGRFILNNRDLSRIRLTADEYVTGLAGVEIVSESEADRLINEGGYRLGTEDSVEQTDMEDNV